MSDLADTTFAMKQTIDDLKGLWAQVANKIDLSENGSQILLFDSDGNRLGKEDLESITSTLQTCRESISILNGTVKTAKFSNLFDAAQTRTDAMAFWAEYADQTGSALTSALGAGKYNVAKFFNNVAGKVAQTVQNTAEAAQSSLPYVVVIAFIVLLIVVLK